MFPGDWPRIMVSAIALTGMCLAIPATFVFSGEIFPTVVRNVGLGSACMFSRLGSVLAPFIKSTVSDSVQQLMSTAYPLQVSLLSEQISRPIPIRLSNPMLKTFYS